MPRMEVEAVEVTREIGGQSVTIQLTEDELFFAYQEQQWLFDLESIRQELEAQPDEELAAQYGLTLSELEPLQREMAAKLRSCLNKEMSWDYALSEAIRSVAERYKSPLQ